jgi:hypothetical protein
MWTQENRPRYNRDHLRYPSDLTDEEWAAIAPLIPSPRPGGGKRRTDMRAVVNGLMYILSTGCQWRYIPKDFRRVARCTTISSGGSATACSIAFITRSTLNAAKGRNAKPVPPPPSSTVRA